MKKLILFNTRSSFLLLLDSINIDMDDTTKIRKNKKRINISRTTRSREKKMYFNVIETNEKKINKSQEQQ